MTAKKEFWIADYEGVKARVLDDDSRRVWTEVHGWSDATEPVGLEFQHIRNVDTEGRGVMAHDAAVLHEGLGWVPCGPPGYDDPALEPEPKSTAKSGSAGDKKE